MFRVMAVKEVHEMRGILLLALAAYVYPVTCLMAFSHLPWVSSWCETTVPFVLGQSDFSGPYAGICFILAIALGLRQTLGEAIGETYPFLLHRPAGRTALVGMKLAMGGGTYLVCAALPILVCGIWAATPGTHAGPFEWSMTSEVWEAWWAALPIYFAAFLCGIRPTRWFGTRLAPLVGGAIAVMIVLGLNIFNSWGPFVLVLVDMALVMAILLVARDRDY